MERLYQAMDREPLADQLVRVDHWEDSDLYEISISYTSTAAQMPMRKLAKIFLTEADIEKLAFTLEAYMEDRTRKEAGL